MSKGKNKLYDLVERVRWEIDNLERYRLGRILTIVDASISDPEQRKAMKDVVRDAFESKECFTDNIGGHIYDFVKKYDPELAKDSEGLDITPREAEE